MLITVSFAFLFPRTLFACACGCNVFSVGARWMMPISEGLRMYMIYNDMDQSKNWDNWQSAAPALNDDKDIKTNFHTLGFQYMTNGDWGTMAEAPVWNK